MVHAYADAVEGLSDEVKDADLEAFYSLWPDMTRTTSDALGEAAGAIHAALAERSIFPCRTSKGRDRVTLAELDILPADAEPALVEALLAQEFRISELPLPKVLTEGAEAAGLELNYVTPASLRELFTVEKHTDCKLEEAPFTALRKREWLEAVTRFILRQKPVKLLGLPLCLLANGELAAFGQAKAKFIFIATSAQRSIFRNYPYWFIDERFLIATELEAQPDAKFLMMTPRDVLRNLGKAIPKPVALDHIQWEPNGEKIPNEPWLIEIYDYIVESSIKISRSEIEDIPLIPDQQGRLHNLYRVSTPLLPTEHARLNAAIDALGLPILSGSVALTKAVRRFTSLLEEHGIWAAEGVDLIDGLAAWHDSWKDRFSRYTRAVHDPILDALSDQQCIEELDDDRIEKLSGLRILPVNDGRIVDSKEPDFYLPAGEQPPPVGGPIHLARLGKREKWRPLLEVMGIKPLDVLMLIDRVLLPALPTLETERQLKVLEFIRTNFDRALQQEAARNEGRTLKSKLGAAPIVRGTDGALHPATSLFSPELESMARVLGSDAIFPELAAYPEPHDAWSDFFHAIGLKTKISAADVVARIDSLAAGSLTTTSRKQMGVVFGYLQKHWQELKSQQFSADIPHKQESLADALKRRKWLPAAVMANFPGFMAPEARWFSPPELYPLSRGHLVAGEAPLLEGQSPTAEMLEALGVPQSPSLDVVLRRMERLLRLVTGSASDWKPDEVKKSFDDICRFLGRNAPPQSAARALLRAQYGNRACIWDHERRRLVRPCDVFQSNVRFFEPHKVRITADPQVSAGLDAMGRRNDVEASDFRDFLDILSRQVGQNSCTPKEQDQALHALNELGRLDNVDNIDDVLPILTHTAKLLPLGEVLFRDNPALASRITDQDVHYAHDAIVGRVVISKLRRLSDAVTEELTEEPMPSENVQMQTLCRGLQDFIRSKEFLLVIRRLISHECRYPVLDYEPPLRKLEVRPASSIRTTLLLADDSGGRPIGIGEPDFFVDRDAERIWIASRKLGALRPKLARAINHLLDEYRLQDTAPLVAILERRDPIETVMENFEITPFIEDRRAGADWRTPSGDGDQEAHHPSEPNDAAAPAEDETWPDGGDDLQADSGDEHPAAADVNGSDVSDGQQESTDTGSALGEDTRGRSRARGSSGSNLGTSRNTKELRRPSGARRNRPPLPGSDAVPPIMPGNGRAEDQAGATSTNYPDAGNASAESAGRTSQTSSTSRRRRGRFYSYASPPPHLGTDGANGRDDDEYAAVEELDIGRAAVALVLTAERAAGRTPVEMSHTNPGYDIESIGPAREIRYIEVKGIDGPWDETGVRLSSTQLKFALEKAVAAWLYVVEHARDPANSRIHRIQDPANTTTDFCFDAGWQAIAVAEANVLEQPVVGAEYLLDDGELVTVVEVQAGAFTRVRVRSHDGSERFVVWKPRRANAAAEG